MNEMNTLNLMLGAIMLAEIANAQKPSVVGRIIIPQDNSYAKSLDTGCEARVYGKKFVCLSEPYVKEIPPFYDGGTIHRVEMVRAMSVETGRVYEVMFAEEFLVSEE